MRELQWVLRWTALLLLGALVLLCVAGVLVELARAGRPERESAPEFFNSVPLAAYWLLMSMVLLVGIVSFRRVLASPGLLAMHLGALLILGGAMWGSRAGHRFAAESLHREKITRGYMRLPIGGVSRMVFDPTERVHAELAFSIRLDDFRIEYYPIPWELACHLPGTPPNHVLLFRWKRDVDIELPGTDGLVLRVTRYVHDGARAMAEVEVTGNGRRMTAVLQPKEGEDHAQVSLAPVSDLSPAPSLFLLRPVPDGMPDWQAYIKAYIAEVTVFRDGREPKRGEIRVNSPMHVDGYDIYQFSEGRIDGIRYSQLAVVSDSGVGVVLAGFCLLVGGAFWWAWIAPAWSWAGRRGAAHD